MAAHSKYFRDEFAKLRQQARLAAEAAAATARNKDLRPEAVQRTVAGLRARPAVGAIELVRQIREAHAEHRAKIAQLKPKREMTALEMARAQRWIDQVTQSGDVFEVRAAAADPAFRAAAALLATPLDLKRMQDVMANPADIPPTSTWLTEVIQQDHPSTTEIAFEEAAKLEAVLRQAAFLAAELPTAEDAAAVVAALGDDVDPARLPLSNEATAWVREATGQGALAGSAITMRVTEQALAAKVAALEGHS